MTQSEAIAALEPVIAHRLSRSGLPESEWDDAAQFARLNVVAALPGWRESGGRSWTTFGAQAVAWGIAKYRRSRKVDVPDEDDLEVEDTSERRDLPDRWVWAATMALRDERPRVAMAYILHCRLGMSLGEAAHALGLARGTTGRLAAHAEAVVAAHAGALESYAGTDCPWCLDSGHVIKSVGLCPVCWSGLCERSKRRKTDGSVSKDDRVKEARTRGMRLRS